MKIVNYLTDYPHPYNKIGDGPEGPEVRTVVDKIRPHIVNKSLNAVVFGPRAEGVNLNILRLPANVLIVRSYGKKILIHLSSNQTIICSLGMTGKFKYSDPGPHTHFRFDFPDLCLYFDDTRYMGSIIFSENAQVPNYFSEVGPDILDAAINSPITPEVWKERYKAKKWQNKQMCQVLLEQSIFSGIGNYLKSEILYYSGISPFRVVHTLIDEEWEKLRTVAHQILLLSYSHGGFTIESFISPDGSRGSYPAAVYGRSFDNLGNVVTKVSTKDQRSTYWVNAVQK